MKKSPIERFRSFIELTPGPLRTPCALWTGKLNQGGGYAYFKVDGKSVRAARWVYEEFIGPLRGEASHLCHDRRCVNPAHIEDEPHEINVDRIIERQAA